MYSKIIINILLIIVLFIIQIAFISGLPSFFSNLNIIIISLIFVLGLISVNLSLWWLIGFGILFEIYSFLPFGIIFIGLVVVFLISNFLLISFFTDRSLYSFLAITFFATIVYELLQSFLYYLVLFIQRKEVLDFFSYDYWIDKLVGVAVNLLAVFIFYNIIIFASRNFKPVFLVKNKK